MQLDISPLVDRAMSWGEFWGICELIMTLGSLSADVRDCVPVLMVVSPEAFLH